jgi:hypothetical protein
MVCGSIDDELSATMFSPMTKLDTRCYRVNGREPER